MGNLKDQKECEYARFCGQKIKMLREKNHYSQQKLAEMINCSVVTLSRVERGVQTMKFWRLTMLCDIFHVSLDYLVRDSGAERAAAVPSYVISLFDSANPSELEILSRYMSSAQEEIKAHQDLERKLQTAREELERYRSLERELKSAKKELEKIPDLEHALKVAQEELRRYHNLIKI